MEKKIIYLDNSATTTIDDNVLNKMMPYLTNKYGNPSSLHKKGIESKNAIYSAKERISNILNCLSEELIFTGSGTESINLSIIGYLRKNPDRNHIITTKIEHKAVLNTFKYLEKEGFKVTYLDVEETGKINLENFKNKLSNNTGLVSIGYVNSEIGTIQDIKSISKICRDNDIVLHIDACQAGNYCNLNVEELGVDMMTLNSGKFYGPKGVGLLYKKRDVKIEPIIHGAGQENALRPGTENVAGIVGFAYALEIAQNIKENEINRIKSLQRYMIDELIKIDDAVLNGSIQDRIVNNINISFLGVEGESLILRLNEEGICLSTGSACSSSDLKPSYVIKEIGGSDLQAHCSIRITIGRFNTKEDIEFVVEKIKENVNSLKKISSIRL